MTQVYPIVLEIEDSGTVSAYVPGLPVYSAADTHTKAERAIRTVLAAYLDDTSFVLSRSWRAPGSPLISSLCSDTGSRGSGHSRTGTEPRPARSSQPLC